MLNRPPIPVFALSLGVLFSGLFVTSAQAQSESADLLVKRYMAEVVDGTLVQSSTHTLAPGLDETSTTVVEARRADDHVTLTIRTRIEAKVEATAEPVVSETIRVVDYRTGGDQLTETSWAVEGEKKLATREEPVALADAGNRLPGFEAYGLKNRPPTAQESVTVPAGTFAARRYDLDGVQFWVADGVPLGGLIKVLAKDAQSSIERTLSVVGTIPAR